MRPPRPRDFTLTDPLVQDLPGNSIPGEIRLIGQPGRMRLFFDGLPLPQSTGAITGHPFLTSIGFVPNTPNLAGPPDQLSFVLKYDRQSLTTYLANKPNQFVVTACIYDFPSPQPDTLEMGKPRERQERCLRLR